MLTYPDFKELLSIFKSNEVRYLIVGGYAVMRYTEPRFTKNPDVLIAANRDNAERVFKSLKEFGAPLKNLSPDDFAEKGYFYQMGKSPLRVDIMMSIPGIEFESAWKRRNTMVLDGTTIPFISLVDLILSKKASGRPQDLLDVQNLEKAEQWNSTNDESAVDP
jgi:uncharacterized nucleotidyltransferase DUF6036